MSKLLGSRALVVASLLGALATACGGAAVGAAAPRVTAVEPVELRGSVRVVDPTPVAELARAVPPRAEPSNALVEVAAIVDRTGRLDAAARARIAERLGRAVARYGAARDDGFIVEPIVERLGFGADLECRIRISIAPRRAGEERWESGRTALATAGARVIGGAGARAVADCVEAAVDRATVQHVLPFLDRVAL